MCINQNDIEEKSEQVALMGKIYRRCAQVRIWLGCDEIHCDLEQSLERAGVTLAGRMEKRDPFEVVRSFAQDGHITDWKCFSKKGDELVYKTSAGFEASWSGFCNVARSSWWTRMWT